MTEVTKDMILDYLVKKGGVVKNVDLVRHFRKYLQVENPGRKDHAREVFKERVNSVASIRAEKGEKYLHLRPEYQGVVRPPSGRTSIAGSERASVSSIEDPRHSLQSRDSLTLLISDLLSPTSTTGSHFNDFGSIPASAQNSSPYSSTGRGGASDSTNMYSSRGKNNVVLQSYKPISSSPPRGTSSATPSYRTSSMAPRGPKAASVSPSHYSSSTNATSTATTTSSSLFSPTASSGLGDMGLGSLSGDLMSSFGDLFSSFGTSTTTAGGLGGLTSSESGSSKLYDSPVAKSTASYSSTTTSSTAAPQANTNQSQRSPRRAPPEAPLNKSVSPPPSNSSLGGTRLSKEVSPRRSPPGPPLGGTNSNRTSTTSIGSGGGGGGVASSSRRQSSAGPSLSLQGSPRRPPPGPPPAGTNSNRASVISSGSGGGVGLSPRRQSSGSNQGPSPSISSSSLQGSPRRPPPGPPPPSTSAAGLLPNSNTTNTAVMNNNSRRVPPPVPSPKTSTLSVGGGTTSSRNYGSNLDPSRKLSYDPQSSPGRTASHYANYGSPYQQQRHSSVTPPTRVMSPPRGSSTNKVTSPPLGGTSSIESPHTNSSTTGSSSVGGLGTFDLGDLTSAFGSFGGMTSSFLDPSPPKSEPPKATSSPSSAAHGGGGPSSSSNLGVTSGPSNPQYAPLSSAFPGSSGSSTVSNSTGPSASNYPISSQYSLLGPSGVQQPPMQLGPPVTAPSGRGGGVSDGTGRRQRSFDRTSRHHNSSDALREQTPPTIRLHASPPPDSPGRDSHSRSPTYSALGPPLDGIDGRFRFQTNANVTSSLGVQLRNKDGKQRSTQGPSVRRSRNMDKNANLDSMTRMSISMTTTPPTSRRNKPEVAPKPSPKPAHRGGAHSFITRSREDLRMEGDDGSMTEMSEQDSWEIDPLEKDWMLASAQADLQGIQQLLMEEPNLVNRKDFIHGYTALHWAAKHGRCDIIAGLMLNGAQVDIKSNGGLTPLHLAAQSGYDNAIEQLISDFGADPNMRDYGGRRPVDILSNKANERAKSLLCQINNHGLPTRVHRSDNLLTFSQPHTKSGGLNRNWSSLGDMVEKRIDKEKHKKIPRMASIRKSFSIHSKKKDYSPSKKEKSKRASAVRPVSDAAAYAYNV